jgi:CRISPR-associated protein Csd2
MTTRGLYVFKHDSELGNAPAHALFERVQVQRNAGVEVPRAFADYAVSVAADHLPNGVTLAQPC